MLVRSCWLLTLAVGVAAAGVAAASDAPPYIAEQTRLAPFSVDLPAGYDPDDDQRYPLVLLLHGRGTNAESMRRFAADLMLEDVLFVRADAPYALGGGEGFEYWPRWAGGEAQSENLVAAARSTAAWCGAVVRAAQQQVRVDPDCVIAIGFSQGGAMAYLAALENPGLFTGVAPLGGWLLPSYLTPESMTMLKEHEVALFIGHGSQDSVIPVARAEAARDLALAAGLDVTARFYPIGHTVNAALVGDLAAWVRRLCAER